jgi:hypothetical protein
MHIMVTKIKRLTGENGFRDITIDLNNVCSLSCDLANVINGLDIVYMLQQINYNSTLILLIVCMLVIQTLQGVAGPG